MVPSVEDNQVLEEFEDVFVRILGLQPIKDIEFSIELVPRATHASNTP